LGGCVIGNETSLQDAVTEMKGEMRDRIRDVKISIGSSCANETTLAEAVKEMKEMKAEISGVKNETDRVLDVLENVVNAIKTIASNQQKNAEDVSKQALVSALVCEYQRLLSVKKILY